MSWFLRLYLRFLWNKKITFTQSDFLGGILYSDSESGCSVTKKKALSFLSRVNWQFLVGETIYTLCVSCSRYECFFCPSRPALYAQRNRCCLTQCNLWAFVYDFTALTVSAEGMSTKGPQEPEMEMRDTFGCRDKATLYSFGETCRPWQIPVKMPEEFALDVNGACITETLQTEQYHCQNPRVRDGDCDSTVSTTLQPFP